MGKTVFQNSGTVVTSKFMRSIYYENGGHKHDGADEDGHCDKITMEELAQNVFEYVQSVVSDRFIGDIRAYAGGENSIPQGYEICDGRSVSNVSQEYKAWVDANRPDLVQNNVYKTPDLRGRVLVGAGTGKDKNNKEITFVLGSTDGEFEHTLGYGTLPAHTHYQDYFKDGTGAKGIADADGGGGYDSYFWLDGQADNVFADKARAIKYKTKSGVSVMWNAVDDQLPHNNIQPYAVVNYIIRVV